jgi:hypothetical protein
MNQVAGQFNPIWAGLGSGLAPLQLDGRSEAPRSPLAVARFIWLRDRRIPNVRPLGQRVHVDLGQLQRLFPSGRHALLIAMNHVVPPRFTGLLLVAMNQIAAQFNAT